MSGFWIVVPVKDTRHSKQRLSGLLDADRRQQLAHAMLADVLEAIAPLSGRAPCALVTVDPYAMSLAGRYGMRVITAGAHDGHTGAVDGARHVLEREGAEGILTMPGDIPLVASTEIEDVLDAHDKSQGFTIVPAGDQLGSNAVACSPPLAVPLRFGENSFYPHLDAARSAGIEPVICQHPGIATDVDEPEDIIRLLELDTLKSSRAARYLFGLGLGADTIRMESAQ